MNNTDETHANLIATLLNEAKQLLVDLKEKGNAVVSKYDLEMGYDAEYYLRADSCLYAQIANHEKQLAELNKNKQLTLF